MRPMAEGELLRLWGASSLLSHSLHLESSVCSPCQSHSEDSVTGRNAEGRQQFSVTGLRFLPVPLTCHLGAGP